LELTSFSVGVRSIKYDTSSAVVAVLKKSK
jgi:hypothetical protein